MSLYEYQNDPSDVDVSDFLNHLENLEKKRNMQDEVRTQRLEAELTRMKTMDRNRSPRTKARYTADPDSDQENIYVSPRQNKKLSYNGNNYDKYSQFDSEDEFKFSRRSQRDSNNDKKSKYLTEHKHGNELKHDKYDKYDKYDLDKYDLDKYDLDKYALDKYHNKYDRQSEDKFTSKYSPKHSRSVSPQRSFRSSRSSNRSKKYSDEDYLDAASSDTSDISDDYPVTKLSSRAKKYLENDGIQDLDDEDIEDILRLLSPIARKLSKAKSYSKSEPSSPLKNKRRKGTRALPKLPTIQASDKSFDSNDESVVQTSKRISRSEFDFSDEEDNVLRYKSAYNYEKSLDKKPTYDDYDNDTLLNSMKRSKTRSAGSSPIKSKPLFDDFDPPIRTSTMKRSTIFDYNVDEDTGSSRDDEEPLFSLSQPNSLAAKLKQRSDKKDRENLSKSLPSSGERNFKPAPNVSSSTISLLRRLSQRENSEPKFDATKYDRNDDISNLTSFLRSRSMRGKAERRAEAEVPEQIQEEDEEDDEEDEEEEQDDDDDNENEELNSTIRQSPNRLMDQLIARDSKPGTPSESPVCSVKQVVTPKPKTKAISSIANRYESHLESEKEKEKQYSPQSVSPKGRRFQNVSKSSRYIPKPDSVAAISASLAARAPQLGREVSKTVGERDFSLAENAKFIKPSVSRVSKENAVKALDVDKEIVLPNESIRIKVRENHWLGSAISRTATKNKQELLDMINEKPKFYKSIESSRRQRPENDAVIEEEEEEPLDYKNVALKKVSAKPSPGSLKNDDIFDEIPDFVKLRKKQQQESPKPSKDQGSEMLLGIKNKLSSSGDKRQNAAQNEVPTDSLEIIQRIRSSSPERLGKIDKFKQQKFKELPDDAEQIINKIRSKSPERINQFEKKTANFKAMPDDAEQVINKIRSRSPQRISEFEKMKKNRFDEVPEDAMKVIKRVRGN